jgi:predicted small integral membrane protein
MDRRALFFLGAALVCLVLVPLTPADLRWFALVLSAVYLLLAVASALDNRSRRRQPPRR